MKVKLLSRVQLSAIPWTAAYQAPPSMGFSRQEYWSGVPLLSLGIVLGASKSTTRVHEASSRTFKQIHTKYTLTLWNFAVHNVCDDTLSLSSALEYSNFVKVFVVFNFNFSVSP